MTLQLDNIIAAAMFTGLRVSGLMIFAPFFGSLVIPARVKAGLVVAVTALLYPVYGMHASFVLTTTNWLGVVVSETLIGLVMGVALNIIFDGAQLAGQILGVQMGFSLVNVIDPQTQVDTPVLSIFHQMITLLIFLQLNVHHWLLRGIASSFEYLPPGTASATPALTETLLHAAGGIWLVGIQIAAPALAATMVADVVLAFLGKASPQLPVLFLGLSIKSVLGFLVMMGAIRFWPSRFEQYFSAAIALCERLLHLAR